MRLRQSCFPVEHKNVSEYGNDNGQGSVEAGDKKVVANCEEAERFISSYDAKKNKIRKIKWLRGFVLIFTDNTSIEKSIWLTGLSARMRCLLVPCIRNPR